MQRIYGAASRARPECVLGANEPRHGTIYSQNDEIVADTAEDKLGLRVLYDAGVAGRISLDTHASGADAPSRTSLPVELYRARADHLRERCAAWQWQGTASSLAAAGADATDEDLVRLLAVSESVALEVAGRDLRARRRAGGLDRFKASCLLPRLDLPPAWLDRFVECFNMATLPFYWKSFEPTPGHGEWSRLERMVSWCEKMRLTPKGHPLVFFHPDVTPPWANPEYGAMKELLCHRVEEVVGHFRGRIDIWDVVNEAHGAANCLKYTYAQLIELTLAACAAARRANPAAVLIVNCTDLWGKLAARSAEHSTLHYCRDIVAAGADFDVIGLQLYFGPGLAGVRDLFEVSRMLDAYGALGKRVHLTEAGFPTATTPDNESNRKGVDVLANGWWHRRWDEDLQAQWITAWATLAAAKPYCDAIGWWDLSDSEPHFHSHSGLLRRDLSPKPGFDRFKHGR